MTHQSLHEARPRAAVCLLFVGVLGTSLLQEVASAQPTTTRVSVGPGGAQADGGSFRPAISPDGRWVVFESAAGNLIAGDPNDPCFPPVCRPPPPLPGQPNVFVRDLQLGTLARVTMGLGGAEPNGGSWSPAISADGRWVAFESQASNIVAGDTNTRSDVFVHDRQVGTTVRVSVEPGGVQGDLDSGGAAISADGRWVAFFSDASNLVVGDTNGAADVFVHDRQVGTTARVSVGAGGVQGDLGSGGAAISADGRWVAFSSNATTLVAGDTNGAADVFVHDRQTGTTTRVSLASGGGQANGGSWSPAISADGRWVAFESAANNLVAGDDNGETDVFVHDLQTGATTRVSLASGGAQANSISFLPAISADGRWVTFYSMASNLVAGDENGAYDVFVHDRLTSTTARVSLGPGGVEANSGSLEPTISADGRWVAFFSNASNLVVGDTNGNSDVFVYDRVDPECAVTLTPVSALAPPAGATATVHVDVHTGCTWTATSNDPAWLRVTGASSGTDSGTVTYGVAANSGAPRNGSITVWGQLFRLHQASATTPETPTGLIASSIVDNVVTLRWRIPPIAPAPTNFVIEGGVSPGEVLASIPTGSAAPTFTFSVPDGVFYVRIYALTGLYRSAASNEILIQVGHNARVPPSAPVNLLGLANGSTLALTWRNTYTGGAPMSLTLYVFGALNTTVRLAMTDTFTFAGVPPGTYAFALSAQNSAGSSPFSNLVGLTFPATCSGPPAPPVEVAAYVVGRTVFVDWAPGASGPAPTSYLLQVTGSLVGSFVVNERAVSGTVPPGSYTLRVAAVNACGASAETVPQTVLVP